MIAFLEGASHSKLSHFKHPALLSYQTFVQISEITPPNTHTHRPPCSFQLTLQRQPVHSQSHTLNFAGVPCPLTPDQSHTCASCSLAAILSQEQHSEGQGGRGDIQVLRDTEILILGTTSVQPGCPGRHSYHLFTLAARLTPPSSVRPLLWLGMGSRRPDV